MCLAENIQYACECYYGYATESICPRGEAARSPESCPNLVKQGVIRRAGDCVPCRRRKASPPNSPVLTPPRSPARQDRCHSNPGSTASSDLGASRQLGLALMGFTGVD
jgi:hypothetical protein